MRVSTNNTSPSTRPRTSPTNRQRCQTAEGEAGAAEHPRARTYTSRQQADEELLGKRAASLDDRTTARSRADRGRADRSGAEQSSVERATYTSHTRERKLSLRIGRTHMLSLLHTDNLTTMTEGAKMIQQKQKKPGCNRVEMRESECPYRSQEHLPRTHSAPTATIEMTRRWRRQETDTHKTIERRNNTARLDATVHTRASTSKGKEHKQTTVYMHERTHVCDAHDHRGTLCA